MCVFAWLNATDSPTPFIRRKKQHCKQQYCNVRDFCSAKCSKIITGLHKQNRGFVCVLFCRVYFSDTSKLLCALCSIAEGIEKFDNENTKMGNMCVAASLSGFSLQKWNNHVTIVFFSQHLRLLLALYCILSI